MNSDSYFEIGSAHLVCQDYALSGTYENLTYGIVSDGCSSAEYSEIGAQILCHVTKNFFFLYYDLFFDDTSVIYIAKLLANSIKAKADEVRKIYPIPRDALQATLLISIIVKKENEYKAFIFAWGDGVIINKSGSGQVSVTEIDYPETNAPVYLMTDIEAYKRKFTDESEPSKFIKRLSCYDSSDSFLCNKSYNLTPHSNDGGDEFFIPYIDSYPLIKGDSIIITTDGLSQYQDQNKNPLKTSIIVPMILDIPNYNGQFIKRTMNFMKRDLIRKNWSHADDIGLASVTI